MPDKYKDVLTGSPVWLALLSAAGGCLVNYLSVYKQTGRLQLRWLFADLVASCFIGYYTFWLMLDWGFAVSECAVGTAIAGNLGTKVFSIIKFLITQKLGVDRELIKEQKHEPDSRNPQ